MATKVIKCAVCGESVRVDSRSKTRKLCNKCLKEKQRESLGISRKEQGQFNNLLLPDGYKRCGYCGAPVKIKAENRNFKTTFCTNSCTQAAIAVIHFKYRTKPTPMTPERKEWLENMGVKVV